MQSLERLTYRGRHYSIQGAPLSENHDLWFKQRIKQTQLSSMALHRGYRGTWAIRGGRLWLDDIVVSVRDYTSPEEWTHGTRGLDWLFPGSDGPVFSEWFTGELPVGVGTVATLMYSRVWPRLRVFTIERGVVVANELRDNSTAYREQKAGFAKLIECLKAL